MSDNHRHYIEGAGHTGPAVYPGGEGPRPDSAAARERAEDSRIECGKYDRQQTVNPGAVYIGDAILALADEVARLRPHRSDEAEADPLPVDARVAMAAQSVAAMAESVDAHRRRAEDAERERDEARRQLVEAQRELDDATEALEYIESTLNNVAKQYGDEFDTSALAEKDGHPLDNRVDGLIDIALRRVPGGVYDSLRAERDTLRAGILAVRDLQRESRGELPPDDGQRAAAVDAAIAVAQRAEGGV